jgi:hypothetical protein
MNNVLSAINQDKEPKSSITRLKRERLMWKNAPRTEHRKEMLLYLQSVIAYKQWLYFRVLQKVGGWKWGITLKS